MDKVWVVTGSEGSYSDQTWWVSCCFDTKAAAEKRAKEIGSDIIEMVAKRPGKHLGWYERRLLPEHIEWQKKMDLIDNGRAGDSYGVEEIPMFLVEKLNAKS